MDFNKKLKRAAAAGETPDPLFLFMLKIKISGLTPKGNVQSEPIPPNPEELGSTEVMTDPSEVSAVVTPSRSSAEAPTARL